MYYFNKIRYTIFMNTSHFQKNLEEEKALLEEEISLLGVEVGGAHHAHLWEKEGTHTGDSMEVAESFEIENEKEAILEHLENRLLEVTKALHRITEGSFGICEICHKEIETARLEANSAARTCIEHREISLTSL
jgi:RNA polymerase-binding transcription factor DksA